MSSNKQHKRQPKTVLAFLKTFHNLFPAERSHNQVINIGQAKQEEMDIINGLPEFNGNPVAVATYDKYVTMAVELGLELYQAQEDLVKIFPNLGERELRKKVISAYQPFSATDKSQPGFWKAVGVSGKSFDAEKIPAADEEKKIDRIVEYLLAIGADEFADKNRLVPYPELSPCMQKVVDSEKSAAAQRKREEREATIHKVDKGGTSDSSDSDTSSNARKSSAKPTIHSISTQKKKKGTKEDRDDDGLSIEEAREQRKRKRKASRSAADDLDLEQSATMVLKSMVHQNEANIPGSALWRLLTTKENIRDHQRKPLNRLLEELGVNRDTISVIADFPESTQELLSLLKPVPAAAAAKEITKLNGGEAVSAPTYSSSSGLVSPPPANHAFGSRY